MSINRIVALLTPVFTAAAALGTAYVARHFPGVPAIPVHDVVVVEVVGATAGLGAALKWLHGHQKYEQILSDAELAVKYIVSQETINAPAPSNDPQKLADAERRAQAAESARADAEHAAGVALTKLAHAQAALGTPPLATAEAVTVAPAPEPAQS